METYNLTGTEILHKTKIDFVLRPIVDILHFMQYDNNLPVIEVELFKNGFSYILPANAEVKIRFGKKDKTFIYKSVLGISDDRKRIYIEIDEQMTYFHGRVDPIVELTINNKLAGSSYIPMYIDRNPVQYTDLESKSETNPLADVIYKASPITYTELKALRDSGSLIPGQFYRLTDYQCTTVQENTQSAGHKFDIIVTADSVDKLNENARAADKLGGLELLPWFEHSRSDPAERFFYVDSVVIEGLTLYRWVSEEELANDIHSQQSQPQYLLTETKDVGIGDVVWGFQIIDESEHWCDADRSGGNVRTIINVGEGYMPGPDYFANSKLEAWKLMYCLDNDVHRFAWADEENGKGVIYRMIDEWNNDCPYDFKNIQFIRKITDGELDLVDGVDTWVYTFTGFSSENNTLIDGTTLKASEYMTDEGSNLYKNNSIGIYEVRRFQEDGFDNILETLSDNVFIGSYSEVPYVEDGPSKLVLFSFDNKLGRDCNFNTFGNSCYGNTFGNYCSRNIFGNYCNSNAFGNSCYSNIFGNSYIANTFGTNCESNTFGNYCSRNTFGNDCYSNIFANYCECNTFGNYYSRNTFGDDCYGNTFGNYCSRNTFGNYCESNTFGNDCRYLKISENAGEKRYLNIDNGLQGASSVNQLELYDSAIADKSYQISFKKASSGRYLMLWATDTGYMTGKYKANATSTTWIDIPDTIDGGEY